MPTKSALAYLELEYAGTILRLSRRRRVPGMEPEDIAQEAAVALLSLSTEVSVAYLYQRADGSMRSASRRAYRRSASEVAIESREVASLPVPDEGSEARRQISISRTVKESLRVLDRQEDLIVRMFHLRRLKPSEIASQRGISPSRVSKIHARALAKMRASLQASNVKCIAEIA